jgi:D-alanyl-D-alanine carboxypeptidase/D-alanyl-D-alanine-endopeptidase (penicillin-binding protein 4)
MTHIKNLFVSIVLLFILQSCAVKKSKNKYLSEESTPYFSGLIVYNPLTNDTLVNYNSEKYFTPASTVKLFTLYTSLHTLKDSIATVSTYETQDRLYIKPLADPSFLHDSLPNSTYDFLSKINKDLLLVSDDFDDFIYGDGWQWDDFQYYYMPEKSIFPIYGNLALLKDNQTLIPGFFNSELKAPRADGFHRDFFQNEFYKDSMARKRRKIPFKTSFELSRQLLSDTLHKPVFVARELEKAVFTPYTSTPTSPIYERLMQESENFIAEQLFLIVAKQKTNQYKVKNAISYALDSLLVDIPNTPKWKDASGLSRYNLFTPKSMLYLLTKLYNDFGEETALGLMPKNGVGGKLQKWYPYNRRFLYAKTGSLSNNHNICGYIKTEKGNLLIFSFMNNNYMKRSSAVRKSMNKVLIDLYKTY